MTRAEELQQAIGAVEFGTARKHQRRMVAEEARRHVALVEAVRNMRGMMTAQLCREDREALKEDAAKVDALLSAEPKEAP